MKATVFAGCKYYHRHVVKPAEFPRPVPLQAKPPVCGGQAPTRIPAVAFNKYKGDIEGFEFQFLFLLINASLKDVFHQRTFQLIRLLPLRLGGSSDPYLPSSNKIISIYTMLRVFKNIVNLSYDSFQLFRNIIYNMKFNKQTTIQQCTTSWCRYISIFLCLYL